MKQWFLALMLVFLTGCNIQTVEHYEEQQAPIERSVTQQETEKAEVEPPSQIEQVQQGTPPTVEQSKPVEVGPANIEQAATETTVTETTEQAEPARQQTTPVVEAESSPPAQQEETSVEVEQAALQPTEPEPTPAAPPVEKKTVTISIDAKTLLNEAHYAKLHPSLRSEKYVPADGVILKPTTYEIVKDNETVFDILQRATREFNIHLEYEGADENIYNSVYIEGINHLYEFSAGNLSGWMYAVNDGAPAKGASQYVVQPNDVITWRYTVDLGKDLDGVTID